MESLGLNLLGPHRAVGDADPSVCIGNPQQCPLMMIRERIIWLVRVNALVGLFEGFKLIIEGVF